MTFLDKFGTFLISFFTFCFSGGQLLRPSGLVIIHVQMPRAGLDIGGHLLFLEPNCGLSVGDGGFGLVAGHIIGSGDRGRKLCRGH